MPDMETRGGCVVMVLMSRDGRVVEGISWGWAIVAIVMVCTHDVVMG